MLPEACADIDGEEDVPDGFPITTEPDVVEPIEELDPLAEALPEVTLGWVEDTRTRLDDTTGDETEIEEAEGVVDVFTLPEAIGRVEDTPAMVDEMAKDEAEVGMEDTWGVLEKAIGLDEIWLIGTTGREAVLELDEVAVPEGEVKLEELLTVLACAGPESVAGELECATLLEG